MPKSALLLITVLFAATAHASLIYYDNTNPANDTLTDPVYSSGYDGIGDSISLAGPALGATDALAQFYNTGAAGIFDASLQFFQAGSPVGSEIGSPYTITGISIASNDYAGVDFILGGLDLPTDIVFILKVSNVGAGVDLGVELYNGPAAVGSNTADKAIFLQGSTYSQQDTGGGNPYFSLFAAPEPSTWLMVVLAFGAAAWVKRRQLPSGLRD